MNTHSLAPQADVTGVALHIPAAAAPSVAAADRPAESAAQPPAGGALALAFSGSGAEYFRIWIVNLLLTLVTLGLYYPWAKVRKLRYFHGHTLIGGHALDFHAEPRRMLRGYLLAMLLLAAYSAAGQSSPVAGVVALLVLATIWPVLFCASMRFRLANTSWRGLRFGFDGDVAGAYKALLPLFVPAVILGALGMAPEAQQQSMAFSLAFALCLLAGVLATPLLLLQLKRYQHNHYAYGTLRTRFEVCFGAFIMTGAKIAGVTLLAGVLFVMLAALGTLIAAWPGGGDPEGAPLAQTIGLLGIFYLVAMIAVLQLIVVPYAVSRLQNLVWSRTSADGLQWRSRLPFRPLALLTLKNWLLIPISLGLYWPFATIAIARMRLQAVSIETSRDLDTIVGRAARGNTDASGDAAGELFGIDIGP